MFDLDNNPGQHHVSCSKITVNFQNVKMSETTVCLRGHYEYLLSCHRTLYL